MNFKIKKLMRSPGSPRSIAFVIHDLNPYGGQERCTLEIARRLSHRWPVEIYAYSLVDPLLGSGWGTVAFHRIRPRLSSPQIIKLLYFYAVTSPLLYSSSHLRVAPPLIHAAGACSLLSDVVQIHFVHASWHRVRQMLPENLRLPPRVSTTSGAWSSLLGLYYELLGRFYMAIERRVFTDGRTYVAVSNRIASELAESFGIKRGVHVIHHGIDPAEFRPVDESTRADRERLRVDLGIRPGEIVAVLVGAYDRKGLASAIEAVARLEPAAREKVRLLAVGAGNATRFNALADRLGVVDNLILAGHRKDVARYYRASDLFLFPTLYEPFGMAILEAMACGLAPIVSRRAGASELIEHGKSGMLLEDPSDAGEIASALGKLVTDEPSRSAMGHQARMTAERRTWDRVADEYADLLRPMLDGRTTHGDGS